MLRAVWIATVLSTGLVVGCTINYGWRTVELDTPWIEPGIHSVQREHSYEHFMAAGRSSTVFWGNADGRGVRRSRVQSQFDRYLQKSGWLDQWRFSESGVNGIQQRIPNYRFTVVAVRPSVVVATPLELGAATNSWNVCGLIDRDFRQRIESDFLDTPLEFGTTVPSATTFTFVNLSRGERRDIPVTNAAAAVEYTTRGCRLTLTPSNGVWRVARWE